MDEYISLMMLKIEENIVVMLDHNDVNLYSDYNVVMTEMKNMLV
jgi:hypothetical protein